ARVLASARVAAGFAFGLVVIAALSMMFALATHDFSILYVAENNARETPLFYSIIGLWAALEGSILLWTASPPGAAAATALGAPLRARLVGAPRRRHRRRRVVELRGARLGRVLGLGSGRERGDHAVAHLHRVPTFGHGRGEAEPAALLEPRPRCRDVRADDPWDVPHAKRRREQRPLVQPLRDRTDPPRLSRRDPRPLHRPSPLAVRAAPRRGTDRDAAFAR